ncbi:SapC family protein [Methylobacterium sp. Leaf125]|uniref:SapC family protein n=1 Tax=Methylobacterium sp. Leaf125 TaxID=1736265 RepID=UPI0006F5E3CC|nr:SapC family protein [Methylobacterium sp. Leaf125]KQQ25256.1 SapC family protein [Methylobacterium sp. Leaf125]
MTGLPLLYGAVVPLDRATQRIFHLANPQRFGFARDSHRVPAAIDAFGPACRHRPILFRLDSLGPTTVFLTGLVPGHWALIDADGAWTGRDRPAYLRRFPFILGGTGDAPPLVCLDDPSDPIRRDSAGAALAEAAPLFREDGPETPLPEERVRPTADDADAAHRTMAFGRTLQDLGLLRALTVQGRDAATGSSHAMHGVLGIHEAALAALTDEDLGRLRREGGLPAIDAHRLSLRTLADFTLAFAPPGQTAA